MERQSYHLIQSFGCRCFLGHNKLENTNRESKSKTQVPMTITYFNHLSPRKLQLCCKKSVNNGDKNKTVVTSKTVWKSNES